MIALKLDCVYLRLPGRRCTHSNLVWQGENRPSLKFCLKCPYYKPAGGLKVDRHPLELLKCDHRAAEPVNTRDVDGQHRACSSCWKYECDLHGECRPAVEEQGVMTCTHCPDRLSADDLAKPFDKVVCVNLTRRPDRLRRMRAKVRLAGVPWLSGVEYFEAFDGNELQIPAGFHGGRGAYGCKLSHLAVLEQAFNDPKIESILVLEDDATFCADFGRRFNDFYRQLPSHWGAIMLGGQKGKGYQEKMVRDDCWQCQDVSRTHAYAVKTKRHMAQLISVWRQSETHIDLRSFRWQAAVPTFRPTKMLCGQDAGKSDISLNLDTLRWWGAMPEMKKIPWYLLRGLDRFSIKSMKDSGLHPGFSLNTATGFDVGLEAALALKGEARAAALQDWCNTVGAEAFTQGLIPCAVHPLLTLDELTVASGVQADLADGLGNVPRADAAALARKTLWYFDGTGDQADDLEALGMYGGRNEDEDYLADATDQDLILDRVDARFAHVEANRLRGTFVHNGDPQRLRLSGRPVARLVYGEWVA